MLCATLLHSFCGSISILADLLLLFCMFRSTPPSFSTFSILLKTHALADLTYAIGAIASMVRLIPIGYSMIYISYGPCSIVGLPTACYGFYMMVIAGANTAMFTILVSFLYRLLIIRNARLSIRQVFAMIVGMIFPIPTVLIVAHMFSLSEEIISTRILYTLYPEYDGKNLTVTGNESIFSFPMIIGFTLLGICPNIECIAVLVIRYKILKELDHLSSELSDKTKAIHRKFVHMLSAQALIPVLQIVAIVTFFTGFFHVLHHPALEASTYLIADITTVFSPFIVFAHIDQYRDTALRFIGRRPNTKTSSRLVLRIQSSISTISSR